MEEKKLTGVVLGSLDYKEKDKIITLFTLQEGIIRAVVKGVKNEKAKLKFAKEPFCFLNVILVKRGQYYTLINADVIDSFFDLTKNLDKFYSGFSLLEIVKAALMEEEPNQLIFVNLLKALKEICYEETNPHLVVLKFMLGVLKVSGYKFNFKKCTSCQMPYVSKKFLNLDLGSFVCGSCVTPSCVFVNNAVFTLLQVLYQTEIDNLSSIQTNESVIKEALKLIKKNFEARVGKNLKTIKELL